MHKKGLVCSGVFILLVGCVLFASPAVAGVGVSPSSWNFGSVSVNSLSSPAVLVLTNNGNRNVSIQKVSSSLAQFIVAGPSLPLTLQGKQSVSFQVFFQPNAAALFSANIVFTINRGSGGTVAVPVSGTGVALTASSATSSPTYLLTPSASSLNFGNILVGSSASQAVTLTNTGNSSVSISQISVSGAGFTASGVTPPVTLSAGQSVSLLVGFSPSLAGSSTGSVTVVSNASNSPATISLAGTGVQPQISVVPTSVNFGNVTVGITNTQSVTVSNPGSANLSITQATVSGTGFALSGVTLPLTLVPGSSAVLTVSFTPASASSTTGALTLVSNAPNSPLSVMLSGTGVSQVLQLSASPTALSFGSVTIGSSGTQAVTLTNTGNSAVTLSQISVAGTGFSYSGLALPISLSAGQSTSFNVIFSPATSGSLTGTATVVSNAANSPTTISLSGSGAALVNHSVNLSWSAGTSSVVGFYIYRGTQTGGPYTRLNSSLEISMTYLDTSVLSGQTYYYVTTDVDSSGLESSYSNEAFATIP
jgi:hypothetical protein